MPEGAAAPVPATPGAAPARPPAALPPRPAFSSGGAAKATAGGLLGVLVVVGIVGTRICRTYKEFAGETVADQTFHLQPGSDRGGALEVKGSYEYTFEVTALDSPIGMFVTRTQSKAGPSPAELAGLAKSMVMVQKGRSHTLTGQFNTGYYAWGIVNPSPTLPARAKVSFGAK